jgi:hypothetical protein
MYSVLVFLATGFYFVATRWGHQAWIGLAILGMVVMAVLGAAVTGRRVKAIATELALSAGPIPPGLRRRLDDRVLRVSVSIRAALGLGIMPRSRQRRPQPLAARTRLRVPETHPLRWHTDEAHDSGRGISVRSRGPGETG